MDEDDFYGDDCYEEDDEYEKFGNHLDKCNNPECDEAEEYIPVWYSGETIIYDENGIEIDRLLAWKVADDYIKSVVYDDDTGKKYKTISMLVEDAGCKPLVNNTERTSEFARIFTSKSIVEKGKPRYFLGKIVDPGSVWADTEWEEVKGNTNLTNDGMFHPLENPNEPIPCKKYNLPQTHTEEENKYDEDLLANEEEGEEFGI
jgi:hypothetical protein